MKAVIQAAGQATRLRPVTYEIPKPLISVKKKPILSHLLESFKAHGVKEATVVIRPDHQEDFSWWHKRHGATLPAISFFTEPEPLGTFGGMKFLQDKFSEAFILANADVLHDFPVSKLIEAHKNNPEKPVATIALVPVENPSDFGVAVMEGNKIKEFLEKPKNPPTNFINAGVYVLEPEVFKYADFSKGALMIEKDIFPKLAVEGKLAGYKFENSRWIDCGTFERWEKAIKEW